MKRASCILVLIFIPVLLWAGDIQVLCDPGLRVLLDGELVGVSNAREDGLYLLDVRKGEHSLQVEKEGHQPQTFQIEVMSLPMEVVVEEAFVPLSPSTGALTENPVTADSEPDVTELVGRLVVTSAPQNCMVEIDGKSIAKTDPFLSFGGFAAGKHRITFSREGFETLSGEVTIYPGAEITIRGNLKDGDFDVVYEGKGSLRITSKPRSCTVRFRGKSMQKSVGRLNQSYIPAGSYLLTVSIPGRTLSSPIVIHNDKRTVVEVSFMKGDEAFVISHVPL